jgi:hypothetical protein
LPCRTALLAKPRYPACHATLLAGFSLQKMVPLFKQYSFSSRISIITHHQSYELEYKQIKRLWACQIQFN